ncbi:hypothetical protein PybrP1_004801 [[Pythium] brassicae (nom. inval.)]|nr:hypothetical protein PybrP1_004801 [[Pythium] brassicae (nom. inval.)]
MPYNVEVTLVKAVDLAAADMNGKSDPYVVLSLGENKRKSSVVAASVNPEWQPEEKFWFLTDDARFAVLDVQVFDHDRFTKDDLIGYSSISLSQFLDGSSTNGTVLMHELMVPNIFERQGRKSVLVLKIKVEEEAE